MRPAHRTLLLLPIALVALAACSSDADTSDTAGPITTNDVSVSTTSVTDTTIASTTTIAAGATAPTQSGGGLPAPDGAYAVGVTDLQRFGMVAYYPAVAGTGHGHRPYASPMMLGTYGVTAEALAAIVPHAEIAATPIADRGAWPVVILAPGGGSLIELSTSLAEDVASHGFVVITVQPDVAVDGGLTRGDAAYSPEDLQVIDEVARQARERQLTDAIDLLQEPLTTRLVGPTDPTRIAVGGHSFGGSMAFNLSLHDDRVAAVFDLDGALFDEANTTPVSVPSLVIMAELYSLHQHPIDDGGNATVASLLALGAGSFEMLRTAPNTVSVALEHAEHYAVTDLAAIAPHLPAELQPVAADGVGDIGAVGTTDTNTIMVRFLEAVFGADPHLPTADELTADLSSVTADPFND